jgi:hypothetical protein
MEENFIGIDVSDSGKDLLIHEHRFDCPASTRDTGHELLPRESESIGPQVLRLNKGIGILSERDPPE